ncbi:MAG: AraC family transcriptional regulator ligand-binding domain-containing protein [Aquabacterium sp.]|uniref:AraC family transcriptional regulator ligand-binding domain-containing protein n=1 Tax=Aquabacterium sp. TaxID=1872578 RepID=UPI003BB0D110
MRRLDTGTPATPMVPALFTRSYLALAAEHGHAPPEVLRQAGITLAEGPAAHELSMDEYLRLLDTITRLMGHISIGTEMGWRIPPTALGPLGAAVLSCATGHDALALCQRFWHFYGMGLTLDITTTDGVCMVEFQTQPALVPATHRHVVLEAVIAGFVRGITGLQRIAPEHFTIWFDLEQPAYAEQVRQRLGHVRWGMPTTSIRLPAHLLDNPLPQASPLALQDAVGQCEQAERLLGKRPDDIGERVRRELVPRDDGYPSLEAVAERLNMSTRTLRRRLQDQGLGFMDLLHAARRRDALSLLERPALEVAQIAQMLGYADPANFTRAFRQWTGLAPSAWRDAHRQA